MVVRLPSRVVTSISASGSHSSNRATSVSVVSDSPHLRRDTTLTTS